ncbi:MAG: rhodanese-like domain-containing protein [Melioribacteraceae bacterium]
MKKLIYLLPIIFVLTTLTVSCQSKVEDKGNVKDNFNMTVEELVIAMDSDTSLVILDVRTPPELVGEHGQIEGVINIPVQVIEKRVSELEKYKHQNIAVICRSGNRSVFGTKVLQKNGYKAKNVMGGMKAYNKIKK